MHIMVCGQLLNSFKVCGDWYCASISQFTLRLQAYSCIVSLSPSDESTCIFTKMDNQKREVSSEDESAVKKKKERKQ